MNDVRPLEFMEESRNSKSFNELQFTGNWFIDAGILGFVDLMEEVYGWDLEELQKKLAQGREKVYYDFFPLAYLFYNAELRCIFDKIKGIKQEIFGKGNKGIIDKIKEKRKELESIENKIKKLDEKTKEFKKEMKRKENVAQKIERLEEKLEEKTETINLLKRSIKEEKNSFYNKFFVEEGGESSKIKNYFSNFEIKTPMIGRNFFLFNSNKLKKDPFNALKYIRYLVEENNKDEFEKFISIITSGRRKKLFYEEFPDSTINPFLHSPSEFSNIGYTLPLSLKKIRNSLRTEIPPVYILFLSFQHAFQPLSGENIMFYTNNLDFCYKVNKRLKIKMGIAREKNRGDSIFHLTWASIVDELIENKAAFSLENMYIVEFNVKTSKLSNVEYIGVSRLQASLVIDDTIRDAINVNIKINEKGDKQYFWLLEEFLKNKPLLPVFYRNLRLYFAGKVKWVPLNSLIYSAALDKAMRNLNTEHEQIFSDTFFERHKSVLEELKGEIQKYFFLKLNVQGVFKDLSEENKKSLAYCLFSRLRKNQKYDFVNEVLKALNQKEGEIKFIIAHLFENILSNENTWQLDAIPIIASLIGKGGGENVSNE